MLPLIHAAAITHPGLSRHAHKHLRALACYPWRHVAHAAIAAALLFGCPDSANASNGQLEAHRTPAPAIASLFSSQASIDADPVDPFTLYGTVLYASFPFTYTCCSSVAPAAAGCGMLHFQLALQAFTMALFFRRSLNLLLHCATHRTCAARSS